MVVPVALTVLSGGALAVVAVPSAFAFASVLADDQMLRLPAPTVTSPGRFALDEVFAMLTETAAATLIAPLEVFAGGVAGAEFPPVAPFEVLASLAKERWPAT